MAKKQQTTGGRTKIKGSAEVMEPKACPVTPSAIYFDKYTLHMVIDEERYPGEACLLCREACSAEAIGIYPSVSPKPFVCDLCDTESNGNKGPPVCKRVSLCCPLLLKAD